MEINYKFTDNRDDAYKIRKAVFMDEQGYKNEFDSVDETCDFVTVYLDGKLAGTGRVFPSPEGEKDTCVFGRIAVLKKFRMSHIGSAVLNGLKKIAKEKGFKRAVLLSQENAVQFYEKNGFSLSAKPVEYDEGHPHRWMESFL